MVMAAIISNKLVRIRVRYHKFVPGECRRFSPLSMKVKFKNQSVLPVKVKKDLPEIKSKDKWKKGQREISVKHSGPSQLQLHYILFYNHCKYVLVPKLITQYKDNFGNKGNIGSLVAKWDELKIPNKYVDYVGCFLPCEKTTFVAPNARKFNRHQSEHPKASHPDIIKTLKNPTKTLLALPTPKIVPVLEEV